MAKFVLENYYGKNVMKITRYHYYESGDISLVRLPFAILHEFGVGKNCNHGNGNRRS